MPTRELPQPKGALEDTLGETQGDGSAAFQLAGQPASAARALIDQAMVFADLFGQ